MKELTRFTRPYIETTGAMPPAFAEMIEDAYRGRIRSCKVDPYGRFDAVVTKGLARWGDSDVRRSILYRFALWRLPLLPVSEGLPGLEPEIYFLMKFKLSEDDYSVRMFVRQDFYENEPALQRQVLKAKLVGT